MLDPQTFTGITREKFASICGDVKMLTGVEVTGDKGLGKDEADRYEISWVYDEPSQTLIIQCMKKPGTVWGVFVQSKIKSIVESA